MRDAIKTIRGMVIPLRRHS